MGKIAALVLSKAASGDFGSGIKAAYWFLAGKKTILGVIFGAVYAVAAYLSAHGGCGTASCDSIMAGVQTVFGWLSAAGLVAGQLDGALRHDAPKG